MAAGLLLAPLVRSRGISTPRSASSSGGGSVCLGYTGHALFLPNWFVRRRGLAISVAYSGVGVGSIILLPWLQDSSDAPLARLLLGAGHLDPGAAGAAQPLLRRRPEDLGLEPDGDDTPPGLPAANRRRTWWTCLGRRRLDPRPRDAHGPLLVDHGRIFLRALRLYAVQVHQTSTWSRSGSARPTPPGRWLREPGGHPRPDRARPSLGPDRARVGVDGGQPGLRALLRGPAPPAPRPDADPALPHGRLAGHARLWPHLGRRRHPRRDFPGPALRHHLRHADAGVHRGRGCGAVGDGRALRRHRQLHAGVLLAIGASVLSAVAIWLAAPRAVRAVAGRVRVRRRDRRAQSTFRVERLARADEEVEALHLSNNRDVGGPGREAAARRAAGAR